MLSARQLTGAAPGGYTVSVASLASADSRTYAWNAGGGTVSVDYKAGDANTTQTKTFDLTGMSLDDAVSTVNSDDDLARLGRQRRRQAVAARAARPATTTPGASPPPGPAVGAQHQPRATARTPPYTVAGDATTYSRTPTSPARACRASS